MLIRVITLGANTDRLDVQAHAPIVSSNHTLSSPRFLRPICAFPFTVVNNNPAAFAGAFWEINALRVYTPGKSSSGIL